MSQGHHPSHSHVALFAGLLNEVINTCFRRKKKIDISMNLGITRLLSLTSSLHQLTHKFSFYNFISFYVATKYIYSRFRLTKHSNLLSTTAYQLTKHLKQCEITVYVSSPEKFSTLELESFIFIFTCKIAQARSKIIDFCIFAP